MLSRVVDFLRIGNNHIGQAWPSTLNCRAAGIVSKCQNIYTQSQYKKIVQQNGKIEAFVATVGGVA